jgi:hypothetical protein
MNRITADPALWWVEACPKCGVEDTYLHVVRESPRRIELRCPDCGKGSRINRTPNPNVIIPNRRRDIDERLNEIVRAYVEEELSVLDLAIRFKASYGAIHRRLREAGVLRPTGYNTPKRDIRALMEMARPLAVKRRQERTRHRQRRLYKQLDAGLNLTEAARRVGIHVNTARRYRNERKTEAR